MKINKIIDYKCHKCDKEFVNSLSLDKHTIAVHEEKTNTDNVYKCHKCGRVFPRLIFLDCHSCNVHDAHGEKK